MYLFCISCKEIVATIKVPTLVCERRAWRYFITLHESSNFRDIKFDKFQVNSNGSIVAIHIDSECINIDS